MKGQVSNRLALRYMDLLEIHSWGRPGTEGNSFVDCMSMEGIDDHHDRSKAVERNFAVVGVGYYVGVRARVDQSGVTYSSPAYMAVHFR